MTERPTKRETEKTFNFVLDEFVRHLQLSQDIENFKQIIQQDGWLYELPFPDGQRRLIGKEAHKRLAKLVRAIIATDDRLIGRIRPAPFLKILSEMLGRAISEREEVKEREFIKSCIKLAISKHLKPREFYIPCIAPYYKGMTKFQIGCVTFYDKDRFILDNSDRIKAFKTLAILYFPYPTQDALPMRR